MKKINLKEQSLEDLKAVLLLPSGETEVVLTPLEVEAPVDFLVQARVSLINKLFFDAIMELQKDVRTVTNDQMLKQILSMDELLNECATLALRIRLRQLKTEVLQEVQEAKHKASTLINLLRTNTGRIDNHQLAQLNDMAYKAV
jgi:hypothetical protein